MTSRGGDNLTISTPWKHAKDHCTHLSPNTPRSENKLLSQTSVIKAETVMWVLSPISEWESKNRVSGRAISLF